MQHFSKREVLPGGFERAIRLASAFLTVGLLIVLPSLKILGLV